MKGLHIVADLYRCPLAHVLHSADALRDLCLDACARAGLSVLGEHFYQFESLAEASAEANGGRQAGGATGAVILAESHLAVHTWPERGEVSLDVYVCNVTADNSLKAENLYQRLLEAFQPADIVVERLWRGKQRALPAVAAIAA
jgi:S-adenosylmethionine/arginine decarboxylase-like enzyme